MTRKILQGTPETLTTIVLLVASVLSFIFINSLVAEPKVLFGRSLTAITPSLFPSITLAMMAIFCVFALVLIAKGMVAPQDARMGRLQWMRAILFFAIMVLYALTMGPFGFLISTALAITMLSIQMGSRAPIQIALVATIGPIILYLAATRLLAVSLPELNAIELFYARIF